MAQKLCEAGRVSINEKPVKPSHAVRAGDEIVLRSRTKITTFRVLSVPDTRQISRKEASSLFEVLSEEFLDEDEL